MSKNYWKKVLEEYEKNHATSTGKKTSPAKSTKSSSSADYWKNVVAEYEETHKKKAETDIGPVAENKSSFPTSGRKEHGVSVAFSNNRILKGFVSTGEADTDGSNNVLDVPNPYEYYKDWVMDISNVPEDRSVDALERLLSYEGGKERIQEIEKELGNKKNKSIAQMIQTNNNASAENKEYGGAMEEDELAEWIDKVHGKGAYKQYMNLITEKNEISGYVGHHEKYGFADLMPDDVLNVLRDEEEWKSPEASKYYDSILENRVVEKNIATLNETVLPNKKITVTEAMKKIAEMDDGAEKDKLVKEVKEAAAKVGFTEEWYDDYYTRITGDSNVTAGHFFEWLGSSLDAGIAQFNYFAASTANAILGGALSSLGWKDNFLSGAAQYYKEGAGVYALEAKEDREKMGVTGGGWEFAEEGLKAAGAQIPDMLLMLATKGMSKAASTGSKALAATAAYESGTILTKAGITAQTMLKNPQFWTSFMRTYGTDYEEAKELGADDLTARFGALFSSMVNAGIEIGFTGESGWQGFATKDKKKLYDWVNSMLEEGNEEVLQGIVSRMTNVYVYGSEEDILQLDTMLKEYGLGVSVGGLMNGGQIVADAGVTGVQKAINYRLTADEKAVVEKEIENRIAEAEKDGKELTDKEKADIRKSVRTALERGEISTEIIEEVLGDDAYTAYKETVDSENALIDEYNAMGEEELVTPAKQARYAELEAKVKELLKEDSTRSELQKQLSDQVFGRVKNSRLAESYYERSNRGKAYEADLSQYDEKQQKVIKAAIDSGILNNTRRAHEFVDLVARISADKGVLFDFTNNDSLKKSSFAIDGVQVNGLVTKDGNIIINVDSSKAVNSVVGHEITHILEGTELYGELETALVEYAKTKKDYQGRLDYLTELYKGKKGYEEDFEVKVNKELVADLVGDYLFTDEAFISRLSTEHRNVFQKVYDEIKYLCKIATAGSKEAIQLEKVKKAFENAYKAETKNTATDGGVRYSLGMDMSETERYNELKDKTLYVVESTDQTQYQAKLDSIDAMPPKAKSKVEDKIYALAEELGILRKPMTTPEIKFDFQISKNNGLKKSLNNQLDYGGSYGDFARALINLDKIIPNAVLIDAYTKDRYADTSRANARFEGGYVLLGAFQDSENIIPVKLTIKKDAGYAGNLYVVVAMTKIKRTSVLGSEGTTPDGAEQSLPDTGSIYSLQQIIANVNTADGDFLKYLPDGFLSEEQIKAKQKAIDKQNKKTAKYSLSAETDTAYMDAVNRGDTATAQKMVDDAAKNAGYTQKKFHETKEENIIHIFDLGLNTNASADYGTPFGIFTKSHNRSVGLGGKQMGLYVKAENTFKLKDRTEIAQKLPPEYSELVDTINAIDEEYSEKTEGLDDDFLFAFDDWLNENDPDDKMREAWDVTKTIEEQFGDVVPQEIIDLERKYTSTMAEWKAKTDKAILDAKEWITKWLRDNGYDSMELEFDNGVGGRVTDALIVLDPNQVKSSDPVTYDDNGNVIPLSERFNAENNDIRYSLSSQGETPKTYGDYNIYGKDISLPQTTQEAEIAPVQETEAPVAPSANGEDMISALWDEEFKLQGYDPEAENYAPATEAEANAVAKKNLSTIRDADAPAEVETQYDEMPDTTAIDDKALGRIGKALKNVLGLDAKEVREIQEVVQKYSTTEYPDKAELFDEIKRNFGERTWDERNDELAEVKQTIRGYRINVSPHIKGDITDYRAFMRSNFGKIKFSNDGLPVDTAYMELSSMYPAYFPEEIENATEQLLRIAEVANEDMYTEQSYTLDDEDIQQAVDVILGEVASYKESQVEQGAEADRQAAFKHIEDIGPVAETVANSTPLRAAKTDRVTQAVVEAIKPKVEKQQRMARATAEEQARAEVMTETPDVKSKKRGLWSRFKEGVLDKGMVFESLSKKTKNRRLEARWNSIRYAERNAQRFIENGRADVSSLNSIRESVEKTGKTKQFYEYLYHKHNIDRMTLEERYEDVQNKPVFGKSVTADVSRETVAKLEAANPEFAEYAQEVYGYMSYLREMLVDNGVISKETADLWAEMYPSYVPIHRKGDTGLNINVPLDTGRTGINAPIKRATGGSRDILPLFDTMGQRTIQTFKAVAKNRFGVELKDTLGTTIESGAVGVDEAIDSIDTQDGLLQEGKNGNAPTFTVFENGEKVTFEITEEMYDAMKPVSDSMAYTNKVANAISNFRRGTLTEYNPWFLLKNAVKDVQDVLINSQHAAKTYANLPSAFKELVTKGKWYQEYMDNGGEQNSYFDNETGTFKKDNKALDIVKKVTGLHAISKANDFVEMIPRLAEYMASRKSGQDIDVSMLDAARVTTNFAAGGDLTKWANRNGFTFLNASVQGAVQQVRNFQEAKMNGVKGVGVLAAKFLVAGVPALILNHIMWDDDEEYEELSDYVKQNYYIVGKYNDGQFVRIPKGRMVAVIQNGFEQMENLITGNDEADLAAFADLLLSNLAPNNPIDNNILSPIVQVANNETWYGEDLVPTRLQDVPAAEQYDESTDAISRWMGETFDISPIKANYLIDQYSGVIGDTFLPMLTPEAESGDNSLAGNMIAPLKDMFSTDSVMNNQNVSDFYDKVDELTVNANGSQATDEDVLMSKYMNSVSADLGKLYQQKREIQSSDLADDVKYERVRDIQRKIDEMAKESLATYEDVSITGKYATVGDLHYRWYEPGEDSSQEPGWRKLTDDQVAKQNEVTSALGITPAQYWGNKDEYDMMHKYPEKYAVLQEQGISVEEYKDNYEDSAFIYTDDFSWASDNPGKYAISKAVCGDVIQYRQHTSAINELEADKDASGKTISGSKKKKVANYIFNETDLDYGQQIILYRSMYDSKDDKAKYNRSIVEYLDSRDDISWDEMKTILEELDFTVYDDGRITW